MTHHHRNPRTPDHASRHRSRNGSRSTSAALVAWTVLVIVIIVTLFPFYWMLRTALSSNNVAVRRLRQPAARATSPWAPSSGCSGCRHGRGGQRRGRLRRSRSTSGCYLRNSVIFATLITAGQVFFCAMAAYAFARLRWPGRDKVFALFLAALMVPPIFTAAAQLRADQEPRPARTRSAGHGPAVPAHDPVRDLLPAPVLPGHQPGDRGGGASTAPAMADLLPDRPADERRADHHPGDPDLHRSWNDYFWPLLVGQHRQRPGAHRRPSASSSRQTPQGSPDWPG